MSLNVLVIPEDFTKDEHILGPLITRLFADLGKPNANVRVCRNPNFQGVAGALSLERLRNEVVARYPMVQVFILLIDRDGLTERDNKARFTADTLDGEISADGRKFLAETARQEVEVFILAGHELPAGWSWRTIREDADVKRTYFRQLVAEKGTANQPHEGRKKLMAEAIGNWQRIKSRCSEDVGHLAEQLGPFLSERT